MKKILALLLTIVLCFGLVGCGSDKNEGSNGEATTTPAAGTDAGNGNETNEPEGDITHTVSQKVLDDSYIAIPTDGVEVSDEDCETAIVNEGNLERLAKVFEKASNGEDITIAYIGGSITDGSLASPQEKNCYAGLTQTWWEYTFQDCNINYVNAGVGATDSYIGVHRVEKDVLSKNPDLVVVEFSVNDYRQGNQETYESLCRKILASENEPAVISLVICQKTGYYDKHYEVGFNLDIPIISYAKVAMANMDNGTWTWEQLGAPDGTHPKNGGHSVIAHLLTYFYNKVLFATNDTKYFAYELPEKTITNSRYENADILYGDNIEATAMEGFEAGYYYSNLFDNNSWYTENGGSIEFEVTAENIGILFWGTTDGKSGQFDVYVDDELVDTIDADFTGQWGSYASYQEVARLGTEKTVKLRIQKKDDSTGDNFAILALAVS